MFAAAVLPAMLNIVFGGFYQSMLHERLSYFITILRTFVCYLAALWFCSHGGMESIWGFFAVAELLTILLWLPRCSERAVCCSSAGWTSPAPKPS